MTNLTINDDRYVSTISGEKVYGLTGNDTLVAAIGGGSLFGGDGDDMLLGSAGDDYLVGDDDIAHAGSNIIDGNEGNDVIVSYSDADQIDGGAGDDDVTVMSALASQTVYGGTGTDTLAIEAYRSSASSVMITVSDSFRVTHNGSLAARYVDFEDVRFFGGTGEIQFYGSDGDDLVSVNGYAETTFDAGTLVGGVGDDMFEISGLPANGTGTQSVSGGEGEDSLSWAAQTSLWSDAELTIDGDSFDIDGTSYFTHDSIEAITFTTNDTKIASVDVSGVTQRMRLILKADVNEVETQGFADQVTIAYGQSTITTSGGKDTITIFSTNTLASLVHAGDGNDSISAAQAQDTLYGDAGNDSISSLNEHAELYGGIGNDSLSLTVSTSPASIDAAILSGGTGTDRAYLDCRSATETFTADFTQGSVTLANGIQVSSVEGMSFRSGSGDDVIVASNHSGGKDVNKIWSGAGRDEITILSKGATVDLGNGDDFVAASSGIDVIIGGSSDSNSAGDTVSYARSKAAITVDLSLSTAQVGTGDAKGDTLFNIENIIGTAHDDRLIGTSLMTDLANTGQNRIEGGAGNDRLTGRGLTDTFVFSTGDDQDIITDFSAKGSAHDVLDLSDVSSIKNFNDLKNNHWDQLSGKVVIDAGGGDTITLLGVLVTDLDKTDFAFV